MSTLFESGRIVDLIVVLVIAEALAFGAWKAWTGRGPDLAGLAGNLLAGLFLLLALRTALVEGWWGWIALCLSGALLAHLADQRGRWRLHSRS